MTVTAFPSESCFFEAKESVLLCLCLFLKAEHAKYFRRGGMMDGIPIFI